MSTGATVGALIATVAVQEQPSTPTRGEDAEQSDRLATPGSEASMTASFTAGERSRRGNVAEHAQTSPVRVIQFVHALAPGEPVRDRYVVAHLEFAWCIQPRLSHMTLADTIWPASLRPQT